MSGKSKRQSSVDTGKKDIVRKGTSRYNTLTGEEPKRKEKKVNDNKRSKSVSVSKTLEGIAPKKNLVDLIGKKTSNDIILRKNVIGFPVIHQTLYLKNVKIVTESPNIKGKIEKTEIIQEIFDTEAGIQKHGDIYEFCSESDEGSEKKCVLLKCYVNLKKISEKKSDLEVITVLRNRFNTNTGQFERYETKEAITKNHIKGKDYIAIDCTIYRHSNGNPYLKVLRLQDEKLKLFIESEESIAQIPFISEEKLTNGKAIISVFKENEPVNVEIDDDVIRGSDFIALNNSLITEGEKSLIIVIRQRRNPLTGLTENFLANMAISPRNKDKVSESLFEAVVYSRKRNSNQIGTEFLAVPKLISPTFKFLYPQFVIPIIRKMSLKGINRDEYYIQYLLISEEERNLYPNVHQIIVKQQRNQQNGNFETVETLEKLSNTSEFIFIENTLSILRPRLNIKNRNIESYSTNELVYIPKETKIDSNLYISHIKKTIKVKSYIYQQEEYNFYDIYEKRLLKNEKSGLSSKGSILSESNLLASSRSFLSKSINGDKNSQKVDICFSSNDIIDSIIVNSKGKRILIVSRRVHHHSVSKDLEIIEKPYLGKDFVAINRKLYIDEKGLITMNVIKRRINQHTGKPENYEATEIINENELEGQLLDFSLASYPIQKNGKRKIPIVKTRKTHRGSKSEQYISEQEIEVPTIVGTDFIAITPVVCSSKHSKWPFIRIIRMQRNAENGQIEAFECKKEIPKLSISTNIETDFSSKFIWEYNGNRYRKIIQQRVNPDTGFFEKVEVLENAVVIPKPTKMQLENEPKQETVDDKQTNSLTFYRLIANYDTNSLEEKLITMCIPNNIIVGEGFMIPYPIIYHDPKSCLPYMRVIRRRKNHKTNMIENYEVNEILSESDQRGLIEVFNWHSLKKGGITSKVIKFIRIINGKEVMVSERLNYDSIVETDFIIIKHCIYQRLDGSHYIRIIRQRKNPKTQGIENLEIEEDLENRIPITTTFGRKVLRTTVDEESKKNIDYITDDLPIENTQRMLMKVFREFDKGSLRENEFYESYKEVSKTEIDNTNCVHLGVTKSVGSQKKPFVRSVSVYKHNRLHRHVGEDIIMVKQFYSILKLRKNNRNQIEAYEHIEEIIEPIRVANKTSSIPNIKPSSVKVYRTRTDVKTGVLEDVISVESVYEPEGYPFILSKARENQTALENTGINPPLLSAPLVSPRKSSTSKESRPLAERKESDESLVTIDNSQKPPKKIDAVIKMEPSPSVSSKTSKAKESNAKTPENPKPIPKKDPEPVAESEHEYEFVYEEEVVEVPILTNNNAEEEVTEIVYEVEEEVAEEVIYEIEEEVVEVVEE